MKTAFITGANSGLGKECARQFAVQQGMKKVYLGCRNALRAASAKIDLETQTNKSIFEVILIDTSDLASVLKAVNAIKEPLDALILNAGGNLSLKQTKDGVAFSFAANVLGHVLLTESLLEANKLNRSIIYASSEKVRGVIEMGCPRFPIKESSKVAFIRAAQGYSFIKSKDPKNDAYGVFKYMGTLWMSTMARKHPQLRFISVSPGLCSGANTMSNLPTGRRVVWKVMTRILALAGKSHTPEEGVARFMDVLNDHETYKSGVFYASSKGVSGPMSDQSYLFADLNSTIIQDNADAAIHHFLQKCS